MTTKDFKSTFPYVSDHPHFPTVEREILAEWEKDQTFQRTYQDSVKENRPLFTFYDGPPFATGLPHYGHILAGSIKDVVCRYQCLKGFQVERRFGWDTHGLPIEFEIDKQEGIQTREQIVGPDGIGIPAYNEKCRGIVMRYAKEWRETINRTGRWIDFDNDYKTMNIEFMESVWWVFGELFKKGLVYKAFKVMPYSMACATPLSNFEASQNYKDVPDPSIIISFPSTDKPGLHFLGWTTTPWTLPMNLAICVKGTYNYCEFSIKEKPEITYVVAESRLAFVCKQMKLTLPKNWPEKDCEMESTNVIISRREVLGTEYVGQRYEPLFSNYETYSYWKDNAYKVVQDNYVTDDAGTGIVHQAPAHGEDDYRVCQDAHIFEKGGQILCPIDFNCNYTTEAPEFIQGMNVKASDNIICEDLKKRGRLMAKQTEIHSYPFCWRSDTPLIYRIVPSWFIDVEAVKDDVVENNKTIRWVPAGVGSGRFHQWLVGAKDWCVSRNRFWGTPIPLWISEDGTQVKCISSCAELEELMIGEKRKITDLHRDKVDDIVIPDPRGESYPPLKRCEEVFDCWFESGSMPYAQVHYPFSVDEKTFRESMFPGDFIAEGIDQTRGWFYTLIVLSTALFGKPSFKNVIVNGTVLASDGKKMSKRLKNYPDPLELIEKCGADALRLYMLSSPVVAAESIKFSEPGVNDMLKQSILPFYHSFRFFIQEVTRYEISHSVKFIPDDDLIHSDSPNKSILDNWLLAAINKLIENYTIEMDAYKLYAVGPQLIAFLEQLTNFYVRLNRDRMKGGQGSLEAMMSLQIIYHVLMKMTILMSPFTPFISEHVYQVLKRSLPEAEQKGTVHELRFPVANAEFINDRILGAQKCLKSSINIVRIMREQRRLPMKTPLKQATLIQTNPVLCEDLKALELFFKEECNCLNVEITSDKSSVEYVAMCNLKNLGRKLGKSMPLVKKAVQAWTRSEIEHYMEKKVATVEGFELKDDDILIKTTAKASDSASEANIVTDSCYATGTVIVVDFEMNDELRAMGIVREVANRVQKLRKSSGLKVDDDDVLMFCQGTGAIKDCLDHRLDMVSKQIRRPLYREDTQSDVHKGYDVWCEETFIIFEDELSLKYYRAAL